MNLISKQALEGRRHQNPSSDLPVPFSAHIFTAGRNLARMPSRRSFGKGGYQPCTPFWKKKERTTAGRASHFRFAVTRRQKPAGASVKAWTPSTRSIPPHPVQLFYARVKDFGAAMGLRVDFFIHSVRSDRRTRSIYIHWAPHKKCAQRFSCFVEAKKPCRIRAQLRKFCVTISPYLPPSSTPMPTRP